MMKIGRCSLVVAAVLLCSIAGRAEAQQQLPAAAIATLIAVLRNSGLNTAALLVTFARQLLRPRTTLLIPNDQAIAAVAPSLLGSSPSSSEQMIRNIISAHILASNFSFDELGLLPVGTQIPTLLNQIRLQVMNNSRDNYILNNAQLQPNDICNQIPDVACYGINQVLSVAGITPGYPPQALSPSPSPPNESSVPPPTQGSLTAQQDALPIRVDGASSSAPLSRCPNPHLLLFLAAAVLASCSSVATTSSIS